MPIITIKTLVKAPIERVFDLSRSIDIHILSTRHTNETAIRGRTTGLIELGETVTWRARHLRIYQTLTVKITHLERPHQFIDVMQKGIFRSFEHQHIFERIENNTLMTDIFEFQSPLGVIGKLANILFLRAYMTNLLKKRNHVIKQIAESGEWKSFI